MNTFNTITVTIAFFFFLLVSALIRGESARRVTDSEKINQNMKWGLYYYTFIKASSDIDIDANVQVLNMKTFQNLLYICMF